MKFVAVFPLLFVAAFGGFASPGGGGPVTDPGKPETKPEAIKIIVDNMNYFRNKHGASALTADSALNAQAQDCANKLLAKNPKDDSVDNGSPVNKAWICDPLSESLQYFCMTTAGIVDEVEVVNFCFKHWTNDEKPSYVFDELRTYVEAARHYTQIIWKRTTKIGIGISAFPTTTNQKVMVALFNPAGNTVNGQSNREFLANTAYPQSFSETL